MKAGSPARLPAPPAASTDREVFWRVSTLCASASPKYYESAQRFGQRASAQTLEKRVHTFRQIPLHLPCKHRRVGLITPFFNSPRSRQIIEPADRVFEIEGIRKW